MFDNEIELGVRSGFTSTDYSLFAPFSRAVGIHYVMFVFRSLTFRLNSEASLLNSMASLLNSILSDNSSAFARGRKWVKNEASPHTDSLTTNPNQLGVPRSVSSCHSAALSRSPKHQFILRAAQLVFFGSLSRRRPPAVLSSPSPGLPGKPSGRSKCRIICSAFKDFQKFRDYGMPSQLRSHISLWMNRRLVFRL